MYTCSHCILETIIYLFFDNRKLSLIDLVLSQFIVVVVVVTCIFTCSHCILETIIYLFFDNRNLSLIDLFSII